MENILYSDIECIKGIGKVRSEKYRNIGISSPYELIYHIPKKYLDFRSFVPVAEAELNSNNFLKLKILSKGKPQSIRTKLTLCKAIATDGKENVNINIFNNVYSFHSLKIGETYYMYGKVTYNFNKYEISSPVYISANDPAPIQPIYKLTQGLTSATLRSDMRKALDIMHAQPFETLPENIIEKYNLMPLMEALENVHFPKSTEDMENARRRLAFDELLRLHLGMLVIRNRNRNHTAFQMNRNTNINDFFENLPFQLTDGQYNAIGEIMDDLCKNTPMNRLLQGDVGSGKTAVAAAVCCFAVRNGFQAAIMAPTSVLAAQHFRTFTNFLSPLGIKTELLTGSVTPKNRKIICERLASGEIDILIGTHAIIQKDIEYKSLGLVITDEQHRFGVEQRSALAEKSSFPHRLVMSATPIPRTLALHIYGDLDISVINHLPVGRTPVITYAVTGKKRDGAFGFLRNKLDEGRQAYIICPMIEESESDLFAVKSYAENAAKNTLKGYTTALLHGKMKSAEKENIMKKFSDGEIQVLICTTVVEVGVDVPNASVILIENAECFGLSQLHQLRGRVGRGKYESFCILITDKKTDDCIRRMKIISSTTDGFKIAEADLEMRGAGDFFGNAQHGLPPLKIADTITNNELSGITRECAENLLAADPELNLPENHALKTETIKLFNKDKGENIK